MLVNRLDSWIAVVSESSTSLIEKLSNVINFADPPEFFSFVCGQWELEKAGTPSCWNFLVDSQVILRAVGQRSVLTREQAVSLARLAMEDDELFDTKLLRCLLARRLWPEEVPVDEAMRTLEVLEALGDSKRLSMTLLKFSKFPDKFVQSKAAKILGRCIESPDVLDELFRNSDGRVRANLLEGIGQRELPGNFIRLIERATGDQHTRVSSVAMALRARLGHSGSAALMKLRAKSKLDDVRKPAEIALRIADGLPCRDPQEGAKRALLGDIDALGVVNPEPAMGTTVDEVDGKA